MRDALLLLFLIIILFTIFVSVENTVKSEGFSDLEKNHSDYVTSKHKRFGNIGISLLAAKHDGALGGSADNILKTYGENASYPLNEARNGLWEKIAKCEAVKKADCSAFDDPEFLKDCGVCLDIGENSDKEKTTGGLLLLPDDKKIIRSQTRANFLPDYKPTVGMCPAKKMVSTKAECLKLQKQLLCEKNASYDIPGCSSCFSTTEYSIIDEKDSPGVITGSGKISVIGLGILKVEEQGFSAKSGIVLNQSRPYVINLRVKEAGRVKFSLSPPGDSDPDNPTPPYMAGMLSGETATGTFTHDIRTIVLVDEVTGRKPRSAGKDTLDNTPITRMAPGFGKDTAVIVVIIPFSFIEQAMEESTRCKDAPFITKQASAEFLQSDPCYKKGSGPGKYNLECLQGAWISNGCTESGKGYPKDDPAATKLMTNKDGSFLTINDISDTIYNSALISSTGVDKAGVKRPMKEQSEASVFCTGNEITSPCDTANKGSGPLTPDCIIYLWNNQGSKKLWTGKPDPIGPTYYASESVSEFNDADTTRGCQVTGLLSPVDARGNRNKDVIKYWQKEGGVNAVKKKMADLHRAANAQMVADDQLAPFFKQCYGDIQFAPRPATVFSIPNNMLPPVYKIKRGQILVNSLKMTQDYKLQFAITPISIQSNWANIIHFTSNDSDGSVLGSRSPAIWFWPGSLKLHIRIGAANVDFNWGIDVDGCQLGKESTFSLECRGTSIKITLDDKVTSGTHPTWRYSGNVKVYGSNPWYPEASADIKNVGLQLFGDSINPVSENPWINALKEPSIWKQMDGGLTNISIGLTGIIFGVNSGDNIYRRDNIHSGWRQLPGALVQIAAQDTNTVIGANRGTYIYRGDGNGGWVNIPGGAYWTTATPAGDTWVVGTNTTSNGRFGFWRKDASNSPNWNSVAGAAKVISAGTGEIWCVQENGDVFRWNGSGWDKKPLPDGQPLMNIAVSLNGKRIVAVAIDKTKIASPHGGRLYAWSSSQWIPITGYLKQVAICDTMIVGVQNNSSIWYAQLPPG
jgi:hypothetical protein